MSQPPEQLSFEVISAEEYFKAQRGTKGPKTEPRNFTTWYGLTTEFGFCTVPRHEDIQRELNPGQKEYRQKYPSRMIFEINGIKVCRDCFLMEADKE